MVRGEYILSTEKDLRVYLKMQIEEYKKITKTEGFSFKDGFQTENEHDAYIRIRAIRNAMDYAWIGVDIETKNQLDEIDRKHEIIERFIK